MHPPLLMTARHRRRLLLLTMVPPRAQAPELERAQAHLQRLQWMWLLPRPS